MARTLRLSGIEVALVVIDGVVDLERTATRIPDKPDDLCVDPVLDDPAAPLALERTTLLRLRLRKMSRGQTREPCLLGGKKLLTSDPVEVDAVA
ncbi:hypothetical protein [Bradyrhizobium sp. BR 1433]|uniref:hypothetical protein n=1 Tax=Bradyrhizobium sp. BR 1433 TaxID=3447967 RepID=UPI003EE45AE0